MTQNIITTLKRRIGILVMPPLFSILAYIQRRPFSTKAIPSAPSRLDKGGSAITCNSESPAATATNNTGPERWGGVNLSLLHGRSRLSRQGIAQVFHQARPRFSRRLPHSKNYISCTDPIDLTIFQKINHVPKKETFHVGC